MNKLAQKIDTASQLAIIIVAILVSVVLVKNYLLNDSKTKSANAPRAQAPEDGLAGKAISLPNVSWNAAEQTLVLALSVGCRYCTDSAPFYKEMANARKGTTRLIAVLPQSLEYSKKYLADLGIKVDEVRQAQVNSIGVRGTPTLLLVNKDGVVTGAWRGQLSTDKEREVIARL